MAKMTKTQARNRLYGASAKLIAVVVEGNHHLSPGDEKKLFEMRQQIMKIALKMM